jgi:hypothetical protein
LGFIKHVNQSVVVSIYGRATKDHEQVIENPAEVLEARFERRKAPGPGTIEQPGT